MEDVGFREGEIGDIGFEGICTSLRKKTLSFTLPSEVALLNHKIS
jgi:hypothetical protein